MAYPNLPENVNSVAEIEELVEKYQIPMREKCRFFINEDYKDPMAFGIYQDGDEWVVYKNKGTGQRVERYRGKSEQYAAQEIWDKFLDETDSRRKPENATATAPKNSVFAKAEKYKTWAFIGIGAIGLVTVISKIAGIIICFSLFIGVVIYAFVHTCKEKKPQFGLLLIAAFLIVLLVISINANRTRHYYHDGGYYHDDNDDYYYRQGDDWYYYDDDDDLWAPYYGDSYDDFYATDSFGGNTYFDDTDYYDDDNAYYDSYDSDSSDSSSSSSDWDSWDSSDTDWDSDW